MSGKRCHYGQYCSPNPCQNGGLCEEGSSGPICQCRGFTGTHCMVDINECLRQNPCHNGGTCINTLGSFKCQCPTGTLLVCFKVYKRIQLMLSFTNFEFLRDHSSITSSKRWVGGVRIWQFLMIYSTVNHQRSGWVGLKKSKT